MLADYNVDAANLYLLLRPSVSEENELWSGVVTKAIVHEIPIVGCSRGAVTNEVELLWQCITQALE